LRRQQRPYAAPGGTIYEDELWIADHGLSRLIAGYVVLKPKRHVHQLADLDPGEATTLGSAQQPCGTHRDLLGVRERPAVR
jgi:diadenosine tetraphosphate (Ap4A) HIT family hydrolase